MALTNNISGFPIPSRAKSLMSKREAGLNSSPTITKAQPNAGMPIQAMMPDGQGVNPFGRMDPFMTSNRLKGFPGGIVPRGYSLPKFSGTFSTPLESASARNQFKGADSLFREFDGYSLDGVFSDEERTALTDRIQQLVIGGEINREQGGNLFRFLTSLFRDSDSAQSGETFTRPFTRERGNPFA
tara:strand:+ start:1335 stop:1889 length:555 start_codon:yes stop_codon:yes gene_type:complete